MALQTTSQAIKLLPPDAIARIESSVTITSLNGVVEELVKNSLDASAQKIIIRVDYSHGDCTVEDDGLGICPTEFRDDGGLAKLHHSSKSTSPRLYHGSRGMFLSALAAMSTLSITSKHHMHHSQNSVAICQSRVLNRHLPSPQQDYLSFKRGTKVSIGNLFGNVPVRVKRRALEASATSHKRDAEKLKRAIVGLLISWPRSVTVSMDGPNSSLKLRLKARETATQLPGHPSFQLTEHVCTLLLQANIIFSAERSSWVPVSASTPTLSIKGVFSLDPAPSKDIQFISLDFRPLDKVSGHNILYEEINKLFSNSSFGIDESLFESNGPERFQRDGGCSHKGDDYAGREFKNTGKGIERWPMFYITINFNNSVHFAVIDNEIGSGSWSNSLASAIELSRAMIAEFLHNNHLSPRNATRQNRNRRMGQVALISSPDVTHERNIKKLASPQPQKVIHTCSSKVRIHASKTSMDFLGTAYNFPSLKNYSNKSQAPHANGLSRIKSGSLRLPSEKTRWPTSADFLRKSVSIPKARGRLVSNTGKLLVPPFGSLSDTRQDTPNAVQTIAGLPKDDTTVWTNPITKMQSSINTRTGFSVPDSTGDRNSTRLHPEQGHGDLPRLSLLSHSGRAPPNTQSSEAWIDRLLDGWNNPVFQTAELPIPHQLPCRLESKAQTSMHGQHHQSSLFDIEQAFKTSAGVAGRISKRALKESILISQVDKKFILIKVVLNGSDCMVIIDQHAADERCRIEALMRELCTSPVVIDSSSPISSRVGTTRLDKPIIFKIGHGELPILTAHAQRFADWGVVYDISKHDMNASLEGPQIVVTHLPTCIMERCNSDARRLIDLIRTDAWQHAHSSESLISPRSTFVHGNFHDDCGQHAWLTKIQHCPKGILEMLNSRACRSSIMFNDELSIDDCKALVSRLADCALPFQCAHGRPSMVPLVNLGTMTMASEARGDENEFAKDFLFWKREK